MAVVKNTMKCCPHSIDLCPPAKEFLALRRRALTRAATGCPRGPVPCARSWRLRLAATQIALFEIARPNDSPPCDRRSIARAKPWALLTTASLHVSAPPEVVSSPLGAL